MSGSGTTEKAGMLETLSKLSNPANHRPLLVNCFGQPRLQALHLIPPVSENSKPNLSFQASVALLIALQLTGVSPLVFFSVK